LDHGGGAPGWPPLMRVIRLEVDGREPTAQMSPDLDQPCRARGRLVGSLQVFRQWSANLSYAMLPDVGLSRRPGRVPAQCPNKAVPNR
jgi:hypothetical protein